MMYFISALALAVCALSATDAFVPKTSAFGLSQLSSSAVILQAEIRGPTEKAEGTWLARADVVLGRRCMLRSIDIATAARDVF
jgi:hypothetical protein